MCERLSVITILTSSNPYAECSIELSGYNYYQVSFTKVSGDLIMSATYDEISCNSFQYEY